MGGGARTTPGTTPGTVPWSAWRALAALVLLSTCLTGSSAGATSAVPASAAGSLVGTRLWVNPSSGAAWAASTARSQGRTADAAALSKLAAQPTAVWLTSAGAAARVREVESAAAGQTPVFVVYYLPGRDCGGFSAGGAPSFAAYATWAREVAAAIGQRAAIVVVEPDAIPELATGCLHSAARSYEDALATAIAALKRQPRAAVYLDAGNPNWVVDVRQLVTPLRLSGLGLADGFALNVANFRTLADNLDYGRRISSLTSGKHFVIDSSRNGLGPLPPGTGYPGPAWCNPPGRASGVAPTTATGQPYVDAYLWVKTPGASDGSCGLGHPPAGTFWPSYALGLIRRAQW
jgi:endoglucanase